jgi:lipoate-protein ligase A
MKTFRLIRSYPASAVYNMALDEKIFSRYLEDGIPVFRVYLWQAPSFTYGVSNHPEKLIDFEQCLSGEVEVVKRMTGGGILFHNDEITYSFVCSKEDVKEPQGVFVSYKEICAFLIRFYESIGLKALFAKETESFKDRCLPHELCSASYEKYDIVINNKKIGGNAQKRRRNAIFQHGSIPCSINWDFVRWHLRSLPEDISSGVTTLSEELAKVPDKGVLEQKLIDAFSSVFCVNFIEEKEIIYETSMVG